MAEIYDTERILVYGGPGSGKSYQALKIAQFIAPTRMHVIDSEGAYPRLLRTEFPGLKNVVLHLVSSWPEWRAALETVLAEAQQDEWVVVDRADMAWEAVQEQYTVEVFGEQMGDWFLQARKEFQQLLMATKEGGKAPKNLVVLEGDRDWQVINRMWKQTWLRLVSPKFPAHLYIACSANPLEKRDKQDVWDTWGWLGQRPAGQKHIPHQVHTVLYMQKVGNDEWCVTTFKDRGRRRMEQERLVSLPAQYLVRLAGWRKAATA